MTSHCDQCPPATPFLTTWSTPRLSPPVIPSAASTVPLGMIAQSNSILDPDCRECDWMQPCTLDCEEEDAPCDQCMHEEQGGEEQEEEEEEPDRYSFSTGGQTSATTPDVRSRNSSTAGLGLGDLIAGAGLDQKAIQEILDCCCCGPSPILDLPHFDNHLRTHQSHPFSSSHPPVVPFHYHSAHLDPSHEQPSRSHAHQSPMMMPTPGYLCLWNGCSHAFESKDDLSRHVNQDHLVCAISTTTTTASSSSTAPLTMPSRPMMIWNDASSPFLHPAPPPPPPSPHSITSQLDHHHSAAPMMDLGFETLLDQHLASLRVDTAASRRLLSASSAPSSTTAATERPGVALSPGSKQRTSSSRFHPYSPSSHSTSLPISPTQYHSASSSTASLSRRSSLGVSFTPPAVLLSLSSSATKSKVKGVVRHDCCWTGCDVESFASTAELMVHLTEAHVGKGKKEYECRWRGCDRFTTDDPNLGEEKRDDEEEEDKETAEGIDLDLNVEGHDEKDERRIERLVGRGGFGQRQKVIRHLQSHVGDRPFGCELCSKTFSEQTTLTQHIRTHTKEKPYECDVIGCGKRFAIMSALTIHARTHTASKPFRCPFPDCEKRFSESSNLSKHTRTHAGLRPFECRAQGCDKVFARGDQLMRHKGVHSL